MSNKKIPIHTIDKKKDVDAGNLLPDYMAYGFMGKHDYLDANKNPMIDIAKRGITTEEEIMESVNIHAVEVISKNRSTYYIKVNNNGRLFNPLDIEGDKVRRTKRESRPEWRFQKTKDLVFNHYLNFLKTRNLVHLKNAEREV